VAELVALDTGIEDRLGRALGGCLADGNPRIRALAIEFFIEWPFAHGWEALVDAVERRPDLYSSVPDVEADDEVLHTKFKTLAGWLMLAFYDHLVDNDPGWRRAALGAAGCPGGRLDGRSAA
jgi:hypothetical protein